MISQDQANRAVTKLRDVMLDTTKASVKKITGAEMKEAQQKQAATDFESAAFQVFDVVVRLVAGHEFPALRCQVENADLKGKITLKGLGLADGDHARLAGRFGQEVTVVLASASEFNKERSAPQIDPDQGDLVQEAERVAAEFDELEEEVHELTPGPLFSCVEVGSVKGPDGAELALFVLLHRDVEVFEPIAAPEYVQSVADALNLRADELHRDLSPWEVRDAAVALMNKDASPVLKGPYTTEAIQASGPGVPKDDDDPATEGAKRGPKTAAEKLAAYFDGYDAGVAGELVDVCPFNKRGALRDEWMNGHGHGKDGRHPSYVRPTPPAANDDDAEKPLFGDGAQGQDSTGAVAA